MPSIKGEDVQLDRSSKRSLKKSRSKICRFSYPNPYLNFLWEYRALPENKSVPLKQLFKIAGIRWKELSLEEKKPYLEAAKGVPKVKEEGYDGNRKIDIRTGSKPKVKSMARKLGSKKKSKGPFTSNFRKSKLKRPRVSPSCSNCGHRPGSRLSSETSVKRRKYEMDDKSESKSGSTASQSTDDSQTSSTKSGLTRSHTKSTIFETDVSSISTF